MWRNPKYPAPEAPAPLAESGRRLATYPRGADTELRVNLCEFEGRPYISLRVWQRDESGHWWPLRGKGCSVRLSEARGLSEVLKAVAQPKQAGRQPTRSPIGRQSLPIPAAAGTGGQFDEFAE